MQFNRPLIHIEDHGGWAEDLAGWAKRENLPVDWRQASTLAQAEELLAALSPEEDPVFIIDGVPKAPDEAPNGCEETLKFLHQDPKARHAPVIALTGGDPTLPTHVKIVSKTNSRAQLVQIIRDLLAEERRIEEPVVEDQTEEVVNLVPQVAEKAAPLEVIQEVILMDGHRFQRNGALLVPVDPRFEVTSGDWLKEHLSGAILQDSLFYAPINVNGNWPNYFDGGIPPNVSTAWHIDGVGNVIIVLYKLVPGGRRGDTVWRPFSRMVRPGELPEGSPALDFTSNEGAKERVRWLCHRDLLSPLLAEEGHASWRGKPCVAAFNDTCGKHKGEFVSIPREEQLRPENRLHRFSYKAEEF